MSIVKDLLANPGVYIGVDRPVTRDLVGASRMLATPLPGGSGVTLDHEIFNPAAPGPVRSSRCTKPSRACSNPLES